MRLPCDARLIYARDGRPAPHSPFLAFSDFPLVSGSLWLACRATRLPGWCECLYALMRLPCDARLIYAPAGRPASFLPSPILMSSRAHNVNSTPRRTITMKTKNLRDRTAKKDKREKKMNDLTRTPVLPVGRPHLDDDLSRSGIGHGC